MEKDKIKYKLKNFKIKVKNFPKKVLALLGRIDIDFFFLFLASYFFNYTYPWYYRLIGAIGVVYIYKILIRDIMVRGK